MDIKMVIIGTCLVSLSFTQTNVYAARKTSPKPKQPIVKQEEKPKQPTVKQEEKPLETIIAPKYTSNSFELVGNFVDKDFIGHDLREVYKSLEARKNREKSEFETTYEYNLRIEKEDKTPLSGNTYIYDNISLLVDVESIYDADTQILQILLPLENSWVTKFTLGIPSRESKVYKDEYIGTNAYGVNVNVKKYTTEKIVLVVNNSEPYEIDNSLFKKKIKITIKDVSVETAKHNKNSIAAICVFKIKSPFVGKDGYHDKATISNPVEMTILNKLLYGDISEIIVYNKKSGQILHRLSNSFMSLDDIPSLPSMKFSSNTDNKESVAKERPSAWIKYTDKIYLKNGEVVQCNSVVKDGETVTVMKDREQNAVYNIKDIDEKKSFDHLFNNWW
ncbi:MAG: hypothetical protein GJT30_07805 [Geobacter sp.]|nr:hypothetical protein [Geobacter sp.]